MWLPVEGLSRGDGPVAGPSQIHCARNSSAPGTQSLRYWSAPSAAIASLAAANGETSAATAQGGKKWFSADKAWPDFRVRQKRQWLGLRPVALGRVCLSNLRHQSS